MSEQIETHHVETYTRNLLEALQQGTSRLRPHVEIEEDAVGESMFVDRIGIVEAQTVPTRNGPSPNMEVPHTRRRITMEDLEFGAFVGKIDLVRMLTDPKSKYAMAGQKAMNRSTDRIIIEELTGTAFGGKKGTIEIPLPARQTIAVDFVEDGTTATSNLTIGKLREAKQLMDTSEVEEEDRVCACSASQIQSLLRTTEITSSDFNTVRALVEGKIDTYLGFKFVRTELMQFATGVIRSAVCFQREALRLAPGIEINTEISKRADASYAWYIYVTMTMGATRLLDEGVVEVLCNEAV